MVTRKKLRLPVVVLIGLLIALTSTAAPVADSGPQNAIDIVLDWLADWLGNDGGEKKPTSSEPDSNCAEDPSCEPEKFPTIDPGG